ncbi:MAG TPA: acyclic terpene utilization AtuA family protein, partial [Bordetella sp.]|nr:acyclic terpene utilization AtuA family protein [Bordetella sp.]
RRVLILETLAERTLALAQLARRDNAAAGYEPLLDPLLLPILARCLDERIAIVSNFGAANPEAAARRILALANQLGLRAPRVAVVYGDDLSVRRDAPKLIETLGLSHPGRLVSANAYLGGEAIAQALLDDADIVVTGRVADPSLVVGPAMAHFGWSATDWDRLGPATMAGHLLECGSQVTGGYFADPGYKDVPGLAHLGFPVAQILDDGHCIIGKADRTGGVVDRRTVTEQLLYELHDPSAYLTPDVTADITHATVTELGDNRVALNGVRGHCRPATLKVSTFYEGGWLGEAEISYAGPRAEARARLAADVIRQRVDDTLRIDLVGVLSLFADDAGHMLGRLPDTGARDVRLRVAGKFAQRDAAEALTREVNALYCCGPAGGGGVRGTVRRRLETRSGFIDRALVPAYHEILA